MSVLKNFYSVTQLEEQPSGFYVAQISLNKNHEIFQGHFPGNPVTPGVCMIQIIKDLTEKIVGAKLFLTSASNVKFMAIINPEENTDLRLELNVTEEGETVMVKNSSYFGETIALKMSANFKKTYVVSQNQKNIK